MNLKHIRQTIYDEVYTRHSFKSKIAKEMNMQPINNWKYNPYLKFKYYIIIELSALISYFCLNFKIHPNTITSAGVITAFISLIFLSSSDQTLILLALFFFFLKNIFDYADGFVARISKKSSEFGAFYDEWSGDFFTLCFYFSLPVYVYNLTGNINYLFLLILLSFLKIINPKTRVLSENYLRKQKRSTRNKIINIFLKIENLKKKKTKSNIREKLIVNFAKLDFDGRTRYTDFLILIILIELYLGKILISNYICLIWVLTSILKILYFFKKLKI